MDGAVIQFTIPGMAGRRRASTPSSYLRDFLQRVKAARITAGLSREDVIAKIEEISGHRVELQTYKKYETRSLMPHHLLIPFCQATDADPWMLLTGTPFRIGRALPSGSRQHAA